MIQLKSLMELILQIFYDKFDLPFIKRIKITSIKLLNCWFITDYTTQIPKNIKTRIKTTCNVYILSEIESKLIKDSRNLKWFSKVSPKYYKWSTLLTQSWDTIYFIGVKNRNACLTARSLFVNRSRKLGEKWPCNYTI